MGRAIELRIPSLQLTPGIYHLHGLIWDHEMLTVYGENLIGWFSVTAQERHIDENYGIFLPDFQWSITGSTDD